MSRYRNERVETIGGFKYITLKSGKRIPFFDAYWQAKSAHTTLVRWMSRMIRLADDESDWERIDWYLDDLEYLIRWYRKEVDKHVARRSTEERIKQLRNTTGRTEDEATAFLAKADELEAELNGTA